MAKLNMSINDIESIQHKLDQNTREISGAPMSYFMDSPGWYPDVSVAVDIAHPIGSVICMSTNENPGTRVGGTWELIDKELKYRWHKFNNDGGWTSTNAKAEEDAAALVGGHAVDFRIALTATATLSDATLTLGYISPAALGLSQFPYDQMYVPFCHDGGGAKDVVGNVILHWDDGRLTIEDVWNADNSHSYAAGGMIFLNMHYAYIPHNMMLEEHCDRFYFKRIA